MEHRRSRGAHDTNFERQGRHAISWSDGGLRIDGAWETSAGGRA